MTSIEHLTLQSFRNITEIKMPFSPGIHFIFGENGSGKTSLLESLYSLTHGRSFRSRQTQQMVQDNKDLFRVIISIRNDSAPYLIGWEKHKKKDSILKVNGDIIQQFSTIAAGLLQKWLGPIKMARRSVPKMAKSRRTPRSMVPVLIVERDGKKTSSNEAGHRRP